jgi:hypothetical protein
MDPVSFQDRADKIMPPSWSASPSSVRNSATPVSDDRQAESAAINPTTKAMAYKNDANDWSGQHRPYHGKFDYAV